MRNAYTCIMTDWPTDDDPNRPWAIYHTYNNQAGAVDDAVRLRAEKPEWEVRPIHISARTGRKPYAVQWREAKK